MISRTVFPLVFVLSISLILSWNVCLLLLPFRLRISFSLTSKENSKEEFESQIEFVRSRLPARCYRVPPCILFTQPTTHSSISTHLIIYLSIYPFIRPCRRGLLQLSKGGYNNHSRTRARAARDASEPGIRNTTTLI